MKGDYRSPWTGYYGLLLLVILYLAAAVRMWKLERPSFWLDEFLTVQLSSGHGFAHLDLPSDTLIPDPPDYIRLEHALPLRAIWTQSDRDVHPPLFYLILRGWRQIAGEGDGVVRLLSVLLSLAAIVMLHAAVSALSGPTCGLWAAAIMAFAGPQIIFAQENRSYMLLLATLLAAAAAAARIDKLGINWRRGAALGLGAFAAAMTHYLAIPVLGAIGLWSLIWQRGDRRRGVCVSLILAGIAYAVIWGPFALRQVPDFDSRMDFTRNEPHRPADILKNFATLPLKFFISAKPQQALTAYLSASLYLLPLLLIRRRPDLLLWWLWLVIGAGSLAVSDLLRGASGLAWIRYSLAVSPAAYALAAAMLAHLPDWKKHLAPLVVAFSCLISIEAAYVRTKPDWRSLGQYIDSHFAPGDILVIYEANYPYWFARNVYLGMNYYAQSLPVPTVFLRGEPTSPVLQQLRHARNIWLYTPGHYIGSQAVFPCSRVVDQALFPRIGTLAKVEIPSQPLNAVVTLSAPEPATQP